MQSQEGGRVNQKQRTRTTLLQAAATLLASGVEPSVAEVAEAASISRATAYRYFPSQDLMLVDAALDAAVPDIPGLLADPALAVDPAKRVDALVSDVQDWVADHETMFRALLRFSMDPTLNAHPDNVESPLPRRRAERRVGWISEALAPVRDEVPEAQFRRLVAALALVSGFETQVVLRDVCQLNRDESLAVARWVAGALLDSTLREVRDPEGDGYCAGPSR